MRRLLLAMAAAFLWLACAGAYAQEQNDIGELRVSQDKDNSSSNAGAPVRHNCIGFSPSSVHVAGDARGYWLASEGKRITRVDGSRAEARLAVYIIRFYGMNEFCRIGGRSRAMSYYLVNGSAPQGRSPSEDCLWFDQTGSRLTVVDGQWTLVDRNNTALSLGGNKAAALEAVSTIRSKNFSEICFVGRPGASMVYFLR